MSRSWWKKVNFRQNYGPKTLEFETPNKLTSVKIVFRSTTRWWKMNDLTDSCNTQPFVAAFSQSGRSTEWSEHLFFGKKFLFANYLDQNPWISKLIMKCSIFDQNPWISKLRINKHKLVKKLVFSIYIDRNRGFLKLIWQMSGKFF